MAKKKQHSMQKSGIMRSRSWSIRIGSFNTSIPVYGLLVMGLGVAKLRQKMERSAIILNASFDIPKSARLLIFLMLRGIETI